MCSESIREIIKRILVRKGVNDNYKFRQISEIIKNCTEGRYKIQIKELKNKKLYIIVDSASALYEMKYFKNEEIINSIKTILNLEIDFLCFKMGNL